jgi:3-deoxy-manno-octulosonate cytidylyltransferase (CMP-KDO synthetase)
VIIDGKSMVQRVYEQVGKSKAISKAVVATDNREIYDHVLSFGGQVCMTRVDHASGTDRCFEVLSNEKQKFDYVLNIQGDEPFIAPEQIDLLASLFDGKTQLATLIKKIDSEEQLFNPNIVKVIANKNQEAIYFSRATLPYLRNVATGDWLKNQTFFKHIGMYGYRADTLEHISALETSPLEKAESLEQLRWIENGLEIKVAETFLETIGIDTPEDLVRALDYLKKL